MNPSSPLDPLFLAPAQPVLRGPAGRALTVVPRAGKGACGAPIAARPWPPDDRGGTVRAWAHAEPHEPLPWVAELLTEAPPARGGGAVCCAP